MLDRLRRSTTFANVCSLLALTVAVGTGGAYAANTVFLNPSSDSTGTGNGTNFDTFVLSAGPDGAVATDMEGNGLTSGGTTPGGDDLVFVFSGNTR